MDTFVCGHESTDEGDTVHAIVHNGLTYVLCNECAESFDYDHPPRPPAPPRRRRPKVG